jgi:hypothetical protein
MWAWLAASSLQYILGSVLLLCKWIAILKLGRICCLKNPASVSEGSDKGSQDKKLATALSHSLLTVSNETNKDLQTATAC